MTQISQNMLKDNDGYLLCKNVKIAHCKPMVYRLSDGREVFISNSKSILEKEFCDSLVGKPLVNEHPDVKLTSNNFTNYIKGVIVKAYADNEDLVADILVYDDDIQSLIMSGKREVSIQVDATLTKLDDNNYIKNPTSFNHLALVDKGRAGREYKFIDSEDKMEDKDQSVSVPTSFLEKLFFKKDKKEDVADTPKVFSDMEDTISTLKDSIASLTEKITAIEEKIKEKEPSNTFSDDDSIISAICEFTPFKKGMNLELGVKSALNASMFSSVGSSAKKLIAGKDIMAMSFSDAKDILASVFELKKAVNTAQTNTQPQQQQTSKLGYISGADLNKLYDKGQQ